MIPSRATVLRSLGAAGVVIAVAWLATGEAWLEPLGTLVASASAFGAGEWVDRREAARRRARQEAFDRSLFKRLEGVLSVDAVIQQIDCLLLKDLAQSTFLAKLDKLVIEAGLESSRFMTPNVQESFDRYAERLGFLRSFLASHFFTMTPEMFGLYPEMREHYDQETVDFYEEHGEKLRSICEGVDREGRAFRAVVRETLMM